MASGGCKLDLNLANQVEPNIRHNGTGLVRGHHIYMYKNIWTATPIHPAAVFVA